MLEAEAEVEETEAAGVTAGSFLIVEQRKRGQRVGLPLFFRHEPGLN